MGRGSKERLTRIRIKDTREGWQELIRRKWQEERDKHVTVRETELGGGQTK